MSDDYESALVVALPDHPPVAQVNRTRENADIDRLEKRRHPTKVLERRLVQSHNKRSIGVAIGARIILPGKNHTAEVVLWDIGDCNSEFEEAADAEKKLQNWDENGGDHGKKREVDKYRLDSNQVNGVDVDFFLVLVLCRLLESAVHQAGQSPVSISTECRSGT